MRTYLLYDSNFRRYWAGGSRGFSANGKIFTSRLKFEQSIEKYILFPLIGKSMEELKKSFRYWKVVMRLGDSSEREVGFWEYLETYIFPRVNFFVCDSCQVLLKGGVRIGGNKLCRTCYKMIKGRRRGKGN